jgi:hypothetical protein
MPYENTGATIQKAEPRHQPEETHDPNWAPVPPLAREDQWALQPNAQPFFSAPMEKTPKSNLDQYPPEFQDVYLNNGYGAPSNSLVGDAAFVNWVFRIADAYATALVPPPPLGASKEKEPPEAKTPTNQWQMPGQQLAPEEKTKNKVAEVEPLPLPGQEDKKPNGHPKDEQSKKAG